MLAFLVAHAVALSVMVPLWVYLRRMNNAALRRAVVCSSHPSAQRAPLRLVPNQEG